MTLEQGWLHALILAHLVQQSRGYGPENAAHWALVRVRRQEIARTWMTPMYARMDLHEALDFCRMVVESVETQIAALEEDVRRKE